MELCGLIKTDSGDVVEVFNREKGGANDLIYNNEPYGIVSMYGFADLKVKSFDKIVTVPAEDGGAAKTKMSDTYAGLYNMLITQARGKADGIVLLEDQLLVIKSTSPFEAVVQPFKLGTAKEFEYKGYVDVSDVDEDTEDFTELMEIFETC